ncbi:DNA cytosine methyltransferase [Streptomyces griseosporeus]|uniref:DNA cytosine methyltransferase n=1 Tax=Streptomyces griseosporeus TaxID=1910 RepID=UPI0037036353
MRRPLRIGSLFTGTGALDLAVMDVFDAEVVWHSQYEPPDKNGKEDTNQYAAKILARHWPNVPNLWDITKVDWQAVIEEHGPVDILTGGFPCQDVSSAGKRAGLTADSRSGLWAHFARAIYELNPRLVVIENVEGLLSAPADRGLGLDAEALEEEARAGRVLRALGAVLGDLATLGFHAEWERVGADEVGAPHRRRRIIIYAWPAHADPAYLGHQRSWRTRGRRVGPSDSNQAAADAERVRRQGERCDAEAQPEREAPAGVRCGSTRSGEAAADADGRRREGHQERDCGPEAGQPERERGLDTVGRGVRGGAVEPVCPTCGCEESFHDAGGFCAGCHHCTDSELGRPDEAPADAPGLGRYEGRPKPEGQQGRPDASECGSTASADTDRVGCRTDVLDLRPGQPDLDWGDYGPAIRRWEAVLGRPAPWPTDALGRLSPVFTEWLMGLPDGWVTDTPGLTRPAMLRALGNGVVWQQAAYALRLLHARAVADQASAA